MRLPPRPLAKAVFGMLPRRSRRYDYSGYVEQYREILQRGYGHKNNARKANLWLAGIVVTESWSYLPDMVRQLLVAITVAAIMNA